MERFECVASKPVFARLALEVLQQQVDLSTSVFLRERYEHIGLAKISVILDDFVLKDQMVSECVPGQL